MRRTGRRRHRMQQRLRNAADGQGAEFGRMRSGGPAREGISAENAKQVQHAVAENAKQVRGVWGFENRENARQLRVFETRKMQGTRVCSILKLDADYKRTNACYRSEAPNRTIGVGIELT